jgi:hypothetical protein
MRMIFGAIGGMKIRRGNRSTRRKPTPAPLCPPQNSIWQTRSRTPDRSGGKPETNCLSYGAAFFSPISSPLTTRRVTVEVFDPASTRVVPILSQIDPIHTIPSYLPMIHFILPTHLCFSLPSGLFERKHNFSIENPGENSSSTVETSWTSALQPGLGP